MGQTKRYMALRACTIICALAYFFAGANAKSPDSKLSGPTRSALERALNKALEHAPDGAVLSWNGYEEVGGTITVLSTTNRRRDAPCRTVRYTVVTATTLTINETRCRTLGLGGLAKWSPRPEEAEVKNKRPPDMPPRPPSNTTSQIAAIQQALKTLMYYRGDAQGHFDESTRVAMLHFLGDERIQALPKSPDQALRLLNAAIARIAHGRCPEAPPARNDAVQACATLTD